MVEILITIVITAVGLIGIAKMQMSALQTNSESELRIIAVELIDDILNRIRSTSFAQGNLYTGTVDKDTPSTKPKECKSDDKCTVAQKISRDLWEWQQSLTGQDGLINASGCLLITSGINRIRVIVSWDGIGNAVATTKTSDEQCGSGDSEFNRRSVVVYSTY